MASKTQILPIFVFLLLFVLIESTYRRRSTWRDCRQRKVCRKCRKYCVNAFDCRKVCHGYRCGPYSKIVPCRTCRNEPYCRRKCRMRICRFLFIMRPCKKCFNECRKRRRCRRRLCRKICNPKSFYKRGMDRKRGDDYDNRPPMMMSPCKCVFKNRTGGCIRAYKFYKCKKCRRDCRKECYCFIYRYIHVDGDLRKIRLYKKCDDDGKKCYKRRLVTQYGVPRWMRVQVPCFMKRKCRYRCYGIKCSMRKCARKCSYPDMRSPPMPPLPSPLPTQKISKPPIPSPSISTSSSSKPNSSSSANSSPTPSLSVSVSDTPLSTASPISSIVPSPEVAETVEAIVEPTAGITPTSTPTIPTPIASPEIVVDPTSEPQVTAEIKTIEESAEPQVSPDTMAVEKSTEPQIPPVEESVEPSIEPSKAPESVVIKRVRSDDESTTGTRFVSLDSSGLSVGDTVLLNFYSTSGTVFTVIINEGRTNVFGLISGFKCPTATPAPLLVPLGSISIPVEIKKINGVLGFTYSYKTTKLVNQTPCTNGILSFEVSKSI